MPKLETYTASGNIRGGPVAAATPAEALTAPYRAVERAGYQIANVGDELSRVAQQKKTEDELKWVTESRAQFDRTLIDRQAEDDKNPRETSGEEFKQFADEQLAAYSKNAPSQRAAVLFREHAMSSVNRGYAGALKDGEVTRLTNADASNQKATADILASYKYEGDINQLNEAYKFQVASIETRFGKTMPKLAAKMTLDTVSEIALGAAATDPSYAKQLVADAPIGEDKKLILNSHIDSIQSSATELAQFRFERGVKAGFDVAEGKLLSGQPAAFPQKLSQADFSIYGKHSQKAFEAYSEHYDIRKNAFDLISDTTGKNANAQQRELNDALSSGDANKVNAAKAAAPSIAQDIAAQKRDPVEYLQSKNDQLKIDQQALSSLPEDSGMQAQATRWYYDRLMELQGHPPPGADNPDDYLGHDQVHVMSAKEADKLKQQINSSNVDYTTFITDTLEQRYGGDPELTARAYSDMLTLGDEKLPVAYKFTGIINDLNTKKGWTAAQKQGKALAEKFKSDKSTDYTDVLKKGDYDKFWRAWIGPNYERTPEVNEATAGMINYAYTLRDSLTPSQAMEEAVRRVVTANYGFAEVHGQIVPIGRHRLLGGPDRTDAEIQDMGRTLQLALRDVPVQEMQLKDPIYGAPHFTTLPPNADMTKPEDAQILRDIVTSTGFWVMEPHGEVVKLYVKEPGGPPFAPLDKRGEHFQFKIDDLPKFFEVGADTGSTATFARFKGIPAVGAGSAPQQVPTKPSSTYPILETKPTLTGTQRLLNYQLFGPFSFFGGLNPQTTIRTNWPVRGSYFQGNRGPALGESP